MSAKCEIYPNCSGFAVSTPPTPWASVQANLQKLHSTHMGQWDDLEAVNSQLHLTAGVQIAEKFGHFSEGWEPLMAGQKFAHL